MKRRLQPCDAGTQEPPRAIDSPYLTADEAVVYLRLGSLSALYRMIRDRRLPYGRVGRAYRFNKRHLDLWVERRGVAVLEDVKRA